MKKTTRNIASVFASSALVIGITSAVLAHPGTTEHEAKDNDCHRHYGGGPGMMMGGTAGMHGDNGAMMGGGMMHGNPVAYAEEQLAEFKTTVNVTAEQEGVWKDYSEAVMEKAALMQSHQQIMMNSEPLKADQHFALHRQSLEQMQKLLSAAEALYGKLSPEQQDKAGNMFGMHYGSYSRPQN
jgi:hypothetical protein